MLSLDVKILHQDMSGWNITVTDPDQNEGFSGMLIGLELGTTIKDGKNIRKGIQRMTGTLMYMALEMIRMCVGNGQPNLEHTYRHDLVFLFYVLLDVCVYYGWETGRGELRTRILGKFSHQFGCARELAWSLRDLLFPLGSELRMGKPAEDESTLYDRMIGAINPRSETQRGLQKSDLADVS
ncbi:hypothetical protein LTR17_024067 [Elasticomyces elasticus]|nr:hypothetical protein LTR17_024067 [Elasticomyces elasticus]